jgi:glycosyltransferase involved in cell wall biosynthesis
VVPESFGRTSIEAQAMGKLVIATDHGGVRETIVANETGYLVPPEDAYTLSAAIAFGLERDETARKAMSTYAMTHVRKHFSSETMKKKTLDVYREVLGMRDDRAS